ncbi:MAG: hypothetical protein O7F76_11610 [Planctomycetota bacterium]|nr:hypothetical protein [Planctomycetota bacterium]MCZ6817323.1 hypothetical protein [Planctomycetota bacterium]
MAEDRKFAFALFDDRDDATVAKTGPAYRLLRDLGIKSTKTVWPLKSEPGYRFFAQSLLDHEYFDFIRELQADGFEIGYHGARTGDNPRSVTHEAFDVFREKIDHNPMTYTQHAASIENLYPGNRRTRIPILESLLAGRSQHSKFVGDDPDNPYFGAIFA